MTRARGRQRIWGLCEALAELTRAVGLARRIGANLNQAVAELNATAQHSDDLLPYAAEAICRAERLDAAAEWTPSAPSAIGKISDPRGADRAADPLPDMGGAGARSTPTRTSSPPGGSRPARNRHRFLAAAGTSKCCPDR